MPRLTKSWHPAVVVTLVAILFATSTSQFAFAIGGPLKSPAGISQDAKYPDHAQEKLVAALSRKDSRFVGGSFVNWISTIRYEGDTRALGLFVRDLSKCPGITVSIVFAALGTEDWVAVHDAHNHTVQIQINLKSKRVDLQDLALPSIKGPALGAEDDEGE